MSTVGMAMVKAYSSATKEERGSFDAKTTAIKHAENVIVRKVEGKFLSLAAKTRAKEQHRQELKTWARIADSCAYKQVMYEARRKWAASVVEAGLCDMEEALVLAKVKFKL